MISATFHDACKWTEMEEEYIIKCKLILIYNLRLCAKFENLVWLKKI